MTKIEKSIRILYALMPENMTDDIRNYKNRNKYIRMLDGVIQTNINTFKTKELYHELFKMGINTSFDMSEHIIERLYEYYGDKNNV